MVEDAIGASHDRFRRANEELQRRYVELAVEGTLPFICECGDRSCTRVVSLTLGEYVEIRGMPGLFAILPGHEAAGERVVRTNDRFAVTETVEERGTATR